MPIHSYREEMRGVVFLLIEVWSTTLLYLILISSVKRYLVLRCVEVEEEPSGSANIENRSLATGKRKAPGNKDGKRIAEKA
ncbi:MAG: hypothetical protein H6Q52_2490 [Deltaproteobacteria bacterium]|nr:hypothetical protein [Deltaproteobacteria bacterium]